MPDESERQPGHEREQATYPRVMRGIAKRLGAAEQRERGPKFGEGRR